MIKVGLTGNLGGGKTFVSKIFETKGVPVYNCDNRSKWLILNNPELISKIKEEFGENIYEGESVFKNISKIAFVEGSKEKLHILMKLISPYFDTDLESFYQKNKDEKFCLVESAILYEYNMEENLDKVIYVTASEETRLKRAMDRDGMSPEDYRIRMQNQINFAEKIKRSEFIIYNDGRTMEELNYEVNYIYNHYYSNNLNTMPYKAYKL